VYDFTPPIIKHIFVTIAAAAATTTTIVTVDVQDGSELGLYLSSSKCEVICHSDLDISDPILQTFSYTVRADATVLGAPLFQESVLDST